MARRLFLVALVASGTAQAQVASVRSQAELLGVVEIVEWAQLFGQLVGLDLVLSPAPAVSDGGTGLNASIPPASAGATPYFRIREQSYDIGGNFLSGDILLGSLADNLLGGPMSFVFDVPVFGFGAQIGPFDWSLAPPEAQPVPCPGSPGCFVAVIEVFDSSDGSLGLFTFNDLLSNTLADGSAPFIGVLSETANIKRAVVRMDDAQSAFQVGQLILAVVPEPGSVPLLAVALAAAVLLRPTNRRPRAVWRGRKRAGGDSADWVGLTNRGGPT